MSTYGPVGVWGQFSEKMGLGQLDRVPEGVFYVGPFELQLLSFNKHFLNANNELGPVLGTGLQRM